MKRTGKQGMGWGVLSVLLALPLAVQAQTYSKTETLEYHDDTTLWVLGQVKRTTTNGVETSRTDYGWKALPWKTYAFGKLQQTLSHDSTSTVVSGQLGTVKTVTDGNGNVTTLGSWKRGIPQTIAYADSTSQSAVVNNNGWIDAVTDANGYTTCYTYDAMGRLTSITYPSETQAGVCDASQWQVTYQSFAPSATSVGGLQAGHWQKTVQTGNARTVTYFDALWRPVIKETYDASDVASTLSQSVTRYDTDGRPVFTSYPQRTMDANVTSTWGNPAVPVHASTHGTYTEYDALGRVTSVTQDSELAAPNNLLVTLTEYLAGFKTRVTNPRGVQTVTEYQTFDQPTTQAPTLVIALGGLAGGDTAVTEIERDAFGKPTRISRRDGGNSLRMDRYYVYDAQQQLCKAIEPETGASLYLYDDAGNLSYSAKGLNLPELSNCNIEPGRPAIARTYDARNRLKTLSFPDGQGNQTWTYTPDGLPASITTHNSAASVLDGTQVVNAYHYNQRRLLTGESVQQPGWYNWSAGYGYDSMGSLSTQVFLDGSTLYYAPNALGQPTRVQDHTGFVFASGAQYHPNGAVKQFTYGNGVVHSMGQNVRRLPQRSTDSGGVLDLDMRYDANGNVTDIFDYAQGHIYNRHMQYDGLDRLVTAASWAFGGDGWHRFTYNALDNLTSWTLAGVKDYANYVYDPSNRLTGIQNSAGAMMVGLSYDAQGNLLNKNGQDYRFDYGNRLREVPGKEHYRYDGQGRRVLAWEPATGSILSQYTADGKLFYQEDHRTGKRIFNVYLGQQLVAIREVIPQPVTQLITKYQHTDALGSPVAVTNELGQVIHRNDYEPYGKVINQPDYGGIGFTGHVQDAVTGLTYMQQRYYDPVIGRFLSVDPVTAYSTPGANFNRYWYANNNPYKFTDPDGRQSKASSKEIGRWIRALWDNNGDFDKAQAQIKKQHEMDLKVANTIIDITAFGTVKDAVEVSVKVANDEDAVGQGTGAIAGEIAGQVAERVLDGKIGGEAASVVGAAVGKAVGDTVEATVDHSRGNNSPGGSEGSPTVPVKPPEPMDLRDKR